MLGKPLPPALRFAVRFALIGLAFYLALYFPHDPGSLPGRMMVGYLESLAFAAGGIVRLFDSNALVAGHLISGRMNLAIVVDCAAVDAQALFAATVLAFPAPWRKKLPGLAAGITFITLINVLRIAALYFVGALWPRSFGFFHEDLFPFAIVAVACASFALWAYRIGRNEGARVGAA